MKKEFACVHHFQYRRASRLGVNVPLSLLPTPVRRKCSGNSGFFPCTPRVSIPATRERGSPVSRRQDSVTYHTRPFSCKRCRAECEKEWGAGGWKRLIVRRIVRLSHAGKSLRPTRGGGAGGGTGVPPVICRRSRRPGWEFRGLCSGASSWARRSCHLKTAFRAV